MNNMSLSRVLLFLLIASLFSVSRAAVNPRKKTIPAESQYLGTSARTSINQFARRSINEIRVGSKNVFPVLILQSVKQAVKNFAESLAQATSKRPGSKNVFPEATYGFTAAAIEAAEEERANQKFQALINLMNKNGMRPANTKPAPLKTEVAMGIAGAAINAVKKNTQTFIEKQKAKESAAVGAYFEKLRREGKLA